MENKTIENCMVTADYHTHTIHSHGKGDIIDNALAAKEKGLKEIAICDHSFGHLLYGLKREEIPLMREKIETCQKETGVKILLGVEANFTSLDGDIDITEEDLKNLDILLVGHHRFVKSKIKDKLKLFLPNLFGVKSKKQIERNTQVLLRAMDKYNINILTHINHHMQVDIEQVAKKAYQTNTLIEINNSKICFSKEEVEILLRENVKFVLSSDAHCADDVGEMTNALEFVRQYNIPLDRIVNLSCQDLEK